MARNVRLRELLVGIEGLALLRHLYDGTDHDANQRLAEVRMLLDDDAFSTAELTSEAHARDGYRSWASRYDEPGNPIIALEEPAVWSLIDPLPLGRALDAACGTGRHARHLLELGHDVVGVDLTPEMLDRAGMPSVTRSSWRPTWSTSQPRTTSSTSLCAASRSRTSSTSTPRSANSLASYALADISSSRYSIRSKRSWVGTHRSKTNTADVALSANTPTPTPTISPRSDQ